MERTCYSFPNNHGLNGCNLFTIARASAATPPPASGLPKLLLSATHLVRLYLYNIPHSGYISPEVMASCLSVLTRLESLVIRFKSPPVSPYSPATLPPCSLNSGSYFCFPSGQPVINDHHNISRPHDYYGANYDNAWPVYMQSYDQSSTF